MTEMKLHTENIGGNLHQAAVWINRQGWAAYVLQMEYTGGSTIAAFKMPKELVHSIRTEKPSYVPAPNHDDYLP